MSYTRHMSLSTGTTDPCIFCDSEFRIDVEEELEHARNKFPGTQYVLAALTEEVGELAQAMLKVEAGKWSADRIWEEAVQVAAMAQRVAVEGDTSFDGDYTEPD